MLEVHEKFSPVNVGIFLSNLICSGFLKDLLTHQTLFTVLKNYLLFQWSVRLHLAILKAFNLRYFEKNGLN